MSFTDFKYLYRSLVQIDNKDAHCPFYALVATLMRIIAGMTRQRFYDYLHNSGQKGRLKTDVQRLMEAVGVPMNLKNYEMKESVSRVVDYW